MDEVRFERLATKDAGRAVAADGVVLLDGPNGIAVSMTPDAAELTGESLLIAAQAARHQNAAENE